MQYVEQTRVNIVDKRRKVGNDPGPPQQQNINQSTKAGQRGWRGPLGGNWKTLWGNPRDSTWALTPSGGSGRMGQNRRFGAHGGRTVKLHGRQTVEARPGTSDARKQGKRKGVQKWKKKFEKIPIGGDTQGCGEKKGVCSHVCSGGKR